MHQTTLIILLKTLTKEEFRRLGKFLNSPFYNYSLPPVLFYENLKRFYPSFDNPKLTRENIWKKIFPNEPFDLDKFWKLTFKLTQLTKQFLVTIELETQATHNDNLLLQALGRKNNIDLFETIMTKQMKDLKRVERKGNKHLENKNRLLQKVSTFHGILNRDKAIDVLEEFNETIDLNFISQKLRLACNLKNVENYLNKKYSFHFLNEISQLLKKGYGVKYPHLDVYFKLFELLKNGREEQYWNLKNAFIDSIGYFSREDKKFIFFHLLNFVILQVNSGKAEFKKENLNLYQEGLQQKLMLENNRISNKTFTNVASTAASLEAFEWTESFIAKYSKNLNEEKQEDAIRMANAYVLFFRKDFSSTIDLLLNYPFTPTIEMIRAKGLLLRCYFELYLSDRTYFELLSSYSNSFERYLRRDNLDSERRVQLYLNFIKTLRKLTLLINERKLTKSTISNFKKQISQKDFILKPWLLEKLKQIKI